jgi:hypothetical protein
MSQKPDFMLSAHLLLKMATKATKALAQGVIGVIKNEKTFKSFVLF